MIDAKAVSFTISILVFECRIRRRDGKFDTYPYRPASLLSKATSPTYPSGARPGSLFWEGITALLIETLAYDHHLSTCSTDER